MNQTEPKAQDGATRAVAAEAILRARKGETCSEITGWQNMPLPENGWLVRGNRGPLLVCAKTADAAISIYEQPAI